MKQTLKEQLSRINSLMSQVITETDWYNIPQWDEKGQNYSNLLGKKTTSDYIENPKINYHDIVTMVDDPFDYDANNNKKENKFVGQVINVFFNKDTKEVMYGVRFFHPEGRTFLRKFTPEELEHFTEPTPEYILNNPKFES